MRNGLTINRIIKSYWQFFILAILILLYTFAFSYFSILRHNAFASGFDLSNMDQTIWNTLHGRIFALTGTKGTISRFSIHADIILILLTPLYLIWDNVRTLLIFQSLSLALGAIPVYLLTFKLLKQKGLALLFVCIYFLNPGMQWVNIYDFHGVALAIPLVLSTFYFAYIKKWRLYLIFAFLSLLTKEEIPLIIALLGLLQIFIWKERKIGTITFVFATLWFSLATFVIIPYFSPSHSHWALLYYRNAGSEFNVEHLTLIPQQIIVNYFINPDDLKYYQLLLKPFAFLPVLGIPWIILVFPDLVINLLSSHAQMRSIDLQYDSGIVPGLLISTIFTISYLKFILSKIKIKAKFKLGIIYIVTFLLLLVTIRANYGYGPLPFSKSCWCVMYQVSSQDIAFDKALQTIPQNASVSSSPEVRPHLTHRLNAFTVPDATSSADFIALIDQNRIVGDYSPKTFEISLIKSLNNNKVYEQIYHQGHFYLYQRLVK